LTFGFVLTGVFFGYYLARKAAIEALRYE